jgi:DNA mismatch repair protein MutL
MYNQLMPIIQLSDDVASQIAAGEVIERPASVVKELMENAIDAGAGFIKINIHGSGQTQIDISDDGTGIPPEELKLAVSRHATSKLSSAEDLFKIQTLGFRGEALASIGSISHMTITSQTEEYQKGAKIVVEGGRIVNTSEVILTRGTSIRVENLFYNVPARLKFLKKDHTEKQAILSLLTRYSLAYPEIRMQVYQDEKPIIQTSGAGDRREVIGNLFDPDLARQLISIHGMEAGMTVEGFISPINVTKSNRREITFFVNGRWVQDSTLSSALLQAYHTYLMVGRYPLAILFITLPAEDIDINVHPAKAEVRFRSPDRVFSLIQRSIRKALLLSSPIPEVPTNSNWQFSLSSQKQSDPAWGMGAEVNQSGFEVVSAGGRNIQSVENYVQTQTVTGIPLLRLIGQVGTAYLVAEGPDGLYLIDQHAAHERVLYEQFIKQKDQPLVSQQLMEAVMVQLSPSQTDLLTDQLPALNHLGFEIEGFGSNSFIIRAIPALFINISPEAALKVLVEDFEEDESPFQTEIEARIVARICKRAAIKAGKTLSTEEQQHLLADLEGCFSPRTCPHGRPTMIHLSVELLERQFGRRGAR